MSIIEVYGTMDRRYLMKKSKGDLATLCLQFLSRLELSQEEIDKRIDTQVAHRLAVALAEADKDRPTAVGTGGQP